MAKQIAPVSLSGGQGFNYEDQVAARFLVDMLAGVASFGGNFGQIVRVDWQAHDAHRLLGVSSGSVPDSHGMICWH
jgi:hypothetical protein